MYLRHLHLHGLTPYLHAGSLQAHLVRAYLDYKAHPRIDQFPKPTLLTFETPPTYTCGRREIGTLTQSQISYLQCNSKAEFHEALRGGQTTFHGPGQLTAYLILSLNAHNLTPKSYVKLLEDVLIDTCSYYGVKGFTTDHPGVWTTEDDKIASLGVHLRRNVSSHGVGLNVNTDLGWFDRIVACGLVGKKATSLEKEGVPAKPVEDVGNILAACMADKLGGVRGVEIIRDENMLLMKRSERAG